MTDQTTPQASPRPITVDAPRVDGANGGETQSLYDASGAWLGVLRAGPHCKEIVRAVNVYAHTQALADALEKIAELQNDKCEHASAEMLFAILDIKVDIARAALAAYDAAKEESQGE